MASDPEDMARRFHEVYERLAPSFGYETREETRAFDPKSPNGRLMVAVCGEILSQRLRRGEDQGAPIADLVRGVHRDLGVLAALGSALKSLEAIEALEDSAESWAWRVGAMGAEARVAATSLRGVLERVDLDARLDETAALRAARGEEASGG